VIYEDEHLLAINKPAGMVVHPTYRHPRGTLMNALLWRARNWPADARPSLVGRLDRLTSGALIAAKSRTMHAALQRVLSSPRSEKQYLAVVYGRVNVTRGTLDAHLSRSRRKRRTVIADSASGFPSQTVFERLRRIKASPIGAALLCCRLMTGRTHQIRVHLSERGHPLIGDPLYGSSRTGRRSKLLPESVRGPVSAFPRQALHAQTLGFIHPISQESLEFKSEFPSDIKLLLDILEQF